MKSYGVFQFSFIILITVLRLPLILPGSSIVKPHISFCLNFLHLNNVKGSGFFQKSPMQVRCHPLRSKILSRRLWNQASLSFTLTPSFPPSLPSPLLPLPSLISPFLPSFLPSSLPDFLLLPPGFFFFFKLVNLIFRAVFIAKLSGNYIEFP